MAEPATNNKTSPSSLMIPDWTQLPEELLEFLTEKLDSCFDVVHARSVCRAWRSTMPFPCSLLRPSYSLPMLPNKNVGLCSLEKVPLVFFRVPTRDGDDGDTASASVYFIGGISRDDSADYKDLPSPLQCSMTVKIPGESEPTLMNILDCQMLSLGYEYRLKNWSPDGEKTTLRNLAFLPLNKEGGGEFGVLLYFKGDLLVLTTRAEMKWKLLENVPKKPCTSLATFRGRFYASFYDRTSVVIDPDSLDVTLLIHSELVGFYKHLVPSGIDELFLVEEFLTTPAACRVSRLDEETGKWVVVTDIGGRVLLIDQDWENVCCSAKELPDCCGLSGNSIVITGEPENVANTFRYEGVEEDDLKFWTVSREKRVTVLSTSPAVALRVELGHCLASFLGKDN
ncbi:unnamed protein product [Microthlaspi erraticum]|uniref:KIB1-4 beta-propeller domain-containing protein n=1 Tax=Microthlaspi erraticum TaxID=1685480 RepID=A0A6D2IUY3_9BRAS|nr:unnamed protein product [Microthlaspi erraticum]